MYYKFDKNEYKNIIQVEYWKGLVKIIIVMALTIILCLRTEILDYYLPEIYSNTAIILVALIGIIIALNIYMKTMLKVEEMKMKLDIYINIVEK